ncbi:hypothetical protein PGTUg99_021257 [Puccinia graminis f. sp. tritici]|uniref:Uncharacterized protein n=1 Tax=Puccinia graminis f. sp. tritici TaxID=56615 RepID=A0A5B0REH0_PUCGR|nr:hypothetical protein PGTUg99_021257 [Puccinia graminis f. sp. tritici]
MTNGTYPMGAEVIRDYSLFGTFKSEPKYCSRERWFHTTLVPLPSPGRLAETAESTADRHCQGYIFASHDFDDSRKACPSVAPTLNTGAEASILIVQLLVVAVDSDT